MEASHRTLSFRACNRRPRASSPPRTISLRVFRVLHTTMPAPPVPSSTSTRHRHSLRRGRPASWRSHATLAVSAAFLASVGPVLCVNAAAMEPTRSNNLVDTSVFDLAMALARDRDSRRLADPTEGVDVKAILQEIGQVDCPDTVNQTVKTYVDVNRYLFDACSEDSGYKLYPYGTKLPDPDETSRICASQTCMDVMTGLILAKLPECEYQRYSPRSMAETFIRVRVSLANDGKAPTASEFGELYTLNRVVNYLTENTTIQAAIKTNFKAAEAAAAMNQLEINPDVVLSNKLELFVSPSTRPPTSSPPDSSTVTEAPTDTSKSTPTTDSAGSSSEGDAATATTKEAGEKELPDNLVWAYLHLGIVWLLTNVVYMWFLSRKGY